MSPMFFGKGFGLFPGHAAVPVSERTVVTAEGGGGQLIPASGPQGGLETGQGMTERLHRIARPDGGGIGPSAFTLPRKLPLLFSCPPVPFNGLGWLHWLLALFLQGRGRGISIVDFPSKVGSQFDDCPD